MNAMSMVRCTVAELGLMVACLTALPALAQDHPTMPIRLAVRPHEMATGIENPRAGEYTLDSLPEYLLYVPERCAGRQRCPLLLFLWSGDNPRTVIEWQRPVAENHGIIILAPHWASPGVSDGGGLWTNPRNWANIDVALQQILQKYAIDPEKIAVLGRCGGGQDALLLGSSHPDAFSRIITISGGVPDYSIPPNDRIAFFVEHGFLEGGAGTYQGVRRLREEGHEVKHVLGLRGHEHQWESYDFLGTWLQESWTVPNRAAHRTPSIVADPLPLLTSEILQRMTTFWTEFQDQPDSIRTTARRAHLREVIVPVGEERPSVSMTDMTALAARYPSVATALQVARLTARQHDAYRLALVSAIVALHEGGEPVDSVQETNMELLEKHSDELDALRKTGIWATP